MMAENVSDRNAEQRLYQLIWKRTIASQMAEARLEKTTIKTKISNRDEWFESKGEVILFDGFLKLYIASKAEDEDDENTQGLLPQVSVGQALVYTTITTMQRFSKPPYRFAEATLVRELEERGIGRPSTYAPTINTIQKRGYVVKESRQGNARNYNVFTLKDKEIALDVRTELAGAERQNFFRLMLA